MLLGYAALAGAAFALAKFSIDPLYVFTEWVPEVLVELSSIAKPLLVAERRERGGGALCQPELLRAGNRARAAALGAAGAAARRMDERPAFFQQARENAGNQPGAVSGVNPPASPRSPDRRR